MVNIYGTQNLNPDFSQFKQIPKFGAEFTLTPVLTIKWPDYSLSKVAKSNRVPEFLKIKRAIVQKRSVLDDIKKFLQLVLTNEIPLVVTGGLTACTGKCKGYTPIEVSVQATVASYQCVFSGLSLKKTFQIPIQLTTPAFSFCLPFLNVCPSNFLKEIIHIKDFPPVINYSQLF